MGDASREEVEKAIDFIYQHFINESVTTATETVYNGIIGVAIMVVLATYFGNKDVVNASVHVDYPSEISTIIAGYKQLQTKGWI